MKNDTSMPIAEIYKPLAVFNNVNCQKKSCYKVEPAIYLWQTPSVQRMQTPSVQRMRLL